MPDETTDLQADVSQALSDLMDRQEAPEAAEETTGSESLQTNQSEEAPEAQAPEAEEEATEEPQAKQEETPEPSGQSEEDTFTKLNPDDLPAEALPYYKSMLADYRAKTAETARKGEEVASYSNVVDAYAPALQQLFGEVQGVSSPSDMAAYALQQMVTLCTDEQAQMQTYMELQQTLAQRGLLQETTPQAPAADGESPTNPALTPELQQLLEQQLQPLQQQQQALQQYLAQQHEAQQAIIQQQQQEQVLVETANEFTSRLDSVKASPEFKDLNEATWDIVQELGIDMNGDFLAAAKMAKKAVGEETAKYLQQKSKQPKVGAGGGGGPAAVPPATPSTIAEANDVMMAKAMALIDQ